MKLIAALDSEVMTKLPVVVHFPAENKSVASNFHCAAKTESIEIRAN